MPFKINNKKQNKKKAQKELAQRTAMFMNLPNNCSICNKDFDKKNKEMVQTWHVVVYESKKKITLICPNCSNREGKV